MNEPEIEYARMLDDAWRAMAYIQGPTPDQDFGCVAYGATQAQARRRLLALWDRTVPLPSMPSSDEPGRPGEEV